MRFANVRKTAIGAILALTVMMVGCGDGLDGVTSGGSGPSATPTPVTGTPTPAATATPTPAPTGTIACKLARQLPNCDASCCSAGGSVIFRTEMEAAEDELARTQPGLFQSNGNVKDNQEYMAALAKLIQNKSNGNICTEVLGHDEIRIKGDQNVSQHVDVLISDVSPWVGGAYTCRPASF